MERKSSTMLNVLLNAAAAIVWTIHCMILVGYTRYDKPPEIILVLDIACAVIWWVAFAAALVRYRTGKRDK